MVALRVVVCFAVFAAIAATDVEQCPGLNIENLSENVQLSPCVRKQGRCILKKGVDQNITITFTPEKDIPIVRNNVKAEIAGVPLPFLGVDGNSICGKIFLENGDKVECPLKAGTKYTYKDSFPVENYYPAINLKIHWGLTHHDNEFICFELPAKIHA